MSFVAGLDLSKNYSFFTIPAAFVLCMLPGTYAYSVAGGFLDMANPRQTMAAFLSDGKMDKVKQQRIIRAQSAEKNGFETVGLYASGVLAANYAGVSVQMLNVLSISYLVSRVGYIFSYIVLCQNRRLAPIRRGVWLVGALILVSFWAMAGYGVNLKQ